MSGSINISRENTLPGAAARVCPHCKSILNNYTHSQSLFMACASCSHYIDYNREQPKLTKFEYGIKPAPSIEIGKTGIIKGVKYKVVGYVYWNEYNTHYYWKEYILFNPLKGYLHLSEYMGHWILLQMTDDHPRKNLYKHAINLEYKEREYKLYNRYHAEAVYAVGEFYWDILGEDPQLHEFIDPPHALVYEKSDIRVAWFKAEHVDRKEVKKAFEIQDYLMPGQYGYGMLQPFMSSWDLKAVNTITIALCLVLVVIQFLFIATAGREIVFNRTFPLEDTTGLRTFVSERFKVQGGPLGYTNLEVEFESNLDNDWAEATITLVNEETDEEYYIDIGAEYYYGSDGDGTWSEGSRSDSRFIAKVPEGYYHIVVTPAADKLAWGKDFSLKILRDVPTNFNFFISILLLIMIPIGLYFLKSYYEKSRWENSDFSPYSYE